MFISTDVDCQLELPIAITLYQKKQFLQVQHKIDSVHYIGHNKTFQRGFDLDSCDKLYIVNTKLPPLSVVVWVRA